MTDKPEMQNVDKPNEFFVKLKIRGKMTARISAENIDDARDKAEKLADELFEDAGYIDLDEIDDLTVYSVSAAPRT